MSIPFEPTRSYVYKAARYELLPRIAEIAKSFGQEAFRLRDIWKPQLAETYTPDQLDMKVKKAQSDATEKMSTIFGFYIPFLAENLKVFENLGGGMFRNIPLEEELAEADAVATDIDANDAGTIYAYSFPSIIKEDGKFPIKVGLTTTGDAQAILRALKLIRLGCSATAVRRPIPLRLIVKGSDMASTSNRILGAALRAARRFTRSPLE